MQFRTSGQWKATRWGSTCFNRRSSPGSPVGGPISGFGWDSRAAFEGQLTDVRKQDRQKLNNPLEKRDKKHKQQMQELMQTLQAGDMQQMITELNQHQSNMASIKGSISRRLKS
jgi:hypothetical protein